MLGDFLGLFVALDSRPWESRLGLGLGGLGFRG